MSHIASLPNLKTIYPQWLQSALNYYWGDGSEDEIYDDGMWDMLAKCYSHYVEHFPLLQKHHYGTSTDKPNCYSLCTVKRQEFLDEINNWQITITGE
jgi:hypothetical protein